MKLLYLTTKDFDKGMNDGVVKKVRYHIDFFKNRGYEVDYTYIIQKEREVHFVLDNNDVVIGTYKSFGGIYGKKIIYQFLKKYFKTNTYDVAYLRFPGGRTDPWLLEILKLLKENKLKILLEIPTYPYDDEGSKFEILIDKLFRMKLQKYVDRVITYSEDNEIFGIKTIQVMNGIKVNEISISNRNKDNSSVNLLAVATFMKCQGYERIIEGLYQYYKNTNNKDVVLHMIGDGDELNYYKKMVEEYNLSKSVVFYGRLSGHQIDEIYDITDISLGGFGNYKKKLNRSSALKIREYLAKGLPIASGITQDIFDGTDVSFHLQYSNDSSVVDIARMLRWYDDLIQKNDGIENLRRVIHKFAEDKADISVVMQPIIEYIDE